MFLGNKTMIKGLLFVGLLMGFTLVQPSAVQAQERKTKQQVKPSYPELAKRMRLEGKVRIEVTIAADGSVKSTRVVGGHPVLAEAAQNAVKSWKYETSTSETTQIVEFVFDLNS